jgi:hypothetical protein
VDFATFYMYFPGEGKAQIAGSRMEGMGYKVEVRHGADDNNWLVLSRKPLPDDELDSAEEELFALTEELDGEFDGYER